LPAKLVVRVTTGRTSTASHRRRFVCATSARRHRPREEMRTTPEVTTWYSRIACASSISCGPFLAPLYVDKGLLSTILRPDLQTSDVTTRRRLLQCSQMNALCRVSVSCDDLGMTAPHSKAARSDESFAKASMILTSLDHNRPARFERKDQRQTFAYSYS